MKDFRKLKVWEIAHFLTLQIYKATSVFPREELYGLTSQIRRSCYSIPANIAEGCGRGSDADFARFLQIAMGSATELEYLLLLATDLKLIINQDSDKHNIKIIEIKKMLTTLIQKLKADSR